MSNGAPELVVGLQRALAQIESDDEPYCLSDRKRFLVEAMTDSPIASRLYQIWGRARIKYELRPDERGEADAPIHCAERQWLAVKDDDAARDTYLDHWPYDVCGYERGEPTSPSRLFRKDRTAPVWHTLIRLPLRRQLRPLNWAAASGRGRPKQQ